MDGGFHLFLLVGVAYEFNFSEPTFLFIENILKLFDRLSNSFMFVKIYFQFSKILFRFSPATSVSGKQNAAGRLRTCGVGSRKAGRTLSGPRRRCASNQVHGVVNATHYGVPPLVMSPDESGAGTGYTADRVFVNGENGKQKGRACGAAFDG
ncbi:MAG: hypothetical protein EPO32_10845 [Anaerolineae bacterium]|nr:MAG: hypothetical protein EPO32_10845 [Anaerolineae bacterium]